PTGVPTRAARAGWSIGRAHVPSPVREEITIERRHPSFSSSPFKGDMTLLRSWFFGTPLRITATVLVISLVVALAIHFKREPTVSASQFLANAIEAQALQTRATVDPVVHQRLQVRRKDQAREASVNFEIWNDTRNSRVREFLTDGNQSIPIPASASTVKDQTRNPGGDLISELEQVLKANHMDPARPLSAASYQS